MSLLHKRLGQNHSFLSFCLFVVAFIVFFRSFNLVCQDERLPSWRPQQRTSANIRQAIWALKNTAVRSVERQPQLMRSRGRDAALTAFLLEFGKHYGLMWRVLNDRGPVFQRGHGCEMVSALPMRSNISESTSALLSGKRWIWNP